jgi:hypothetical protein
MDQSRNGTMSSAILTVADALLERLVRNAYPLK